MEEFSSNDAYTGGFNSGAKDPYAFLNGWAGARCGAKTGVGVRIACRRETSADYDARMESAPLACKIKKAVTLRVSFDYGSGGSYTTLIGKAVGQTVYVGYITTTSNYKSNSTEGTYPLSFHIDAADCDGNDGGYSSTSNSYSKTFSAPVTDILRISWRTEIDHKAGTNNNTDWLYVDNVKVVVVP